ncbi:MAG: succinate dehydrogenase assembly factor 2 [Rhodanobacteraceae bacterium]
MGVPALGKDASPPNDARLKRIQWRCRRGTRELDALLGDWLKEHSVSMDDAQFAAFDALLDQQDPELWDWLMGHAEPPRDDWRAIVDDIRRRARLVP